MTQQRREAASRAFAEHPNEASSDLEVICYDEQDLIKCCCDLHNVQETYRSYRTAWLNVDGVESQTSLDALSTAFGFPQLLVGKIQKKSKYPQKGLYDGTLFVTCWMFSNKNTLPTHEGEKLSIVLSSQYLITFQGSRGDGDCLDNLRKEIEENKDDVRAKGTDNLLFLILKNVVTYYSLILDREKSSDRLQQLLDHIQDLKDKAAHHLQCFAGFPLLPDQIPSTAPHKSLQDLETRLTQFLDLLRTTTPALDQIERQLCHIQRQPDLSLHDHNMKLSVLAERLEKHEDELLEGIDLAKALRKMKKIGDAFKLLPPNQQRPSTFAHLDALEDKIRDIHRASILKLIRRNRAKSMAEHMDDLEYKILNRDFDTFKSREIITQLHQHQNALAQYLKHLKPLLETINYLKNPNTAPHLLSEPTRRDFKDLKEVIDMMLDSIKTYQNIATNLLNLHVSLESYKMNKVMKIFAFMSVLSTPVVVIAGIYGMNFDPNTSSYNMPELHWPYGYAGALAAMAFLAGLVFLSFWASGWISDILPSKQALKRLLRRK